MHEFMNLSITQVDIAECERLPNSLRSCDHGPSTLKFAYLAMKMHLASAVQQQGLLFGQIRQQPQGPLEQALQMGLGRRRAQQAVGTPVGGDDPAAVIEEQQASPGTVQIVLAGIEDQLMMLAVKLIEDQAVFNRLTEH